jgi:hypothetical protein
MGIRWMIVFVGLLALALVAGCGGGKLDSAETPSAQAGGTTEGHQSGMNAPAAVGDGMVVGVVTETMNTSGYTYVSVDADNGESVWAAAPEFAVQVGDRVVVPTNMPMPGYHSQTLDRTFDMLYFANAIMIEGEDGQPGDGGLPSGHPDLGMGGSQSGSPMAPTPSDMDFSGIAKADGGMTIAEVYAKRPDLGGKEIAVRGKVVKYTGGVMGRNWIHIQDGTGEAGSNDLTVTTMTTANLGSTVLVRGVAAVDKDFGAGYFYPVIVEEAEVVIEDNAGEAAGS